MASTKLPHMLLFRGSDWAKGLSPEEMQKVGEKWMAWYDGLVAKGIAKSGHPLESTGKLVSGKNGSVISDGPFAETKETIAGYFFLEVENFDEAVAIAKQCPGLPYGAIVEVRPVADSCPIEKRGRSMMEVEKLVAAQV